MLGKLYIHSQGRGKVNFLQGKETGKGGKKARLIKSGFFPAFPCCVSHWGNAGFNVSQFGRGGGKLECSLGKGLRMS